MNSRNEDPISMIFVCRFCSSMLKEPVQLICGHRYCQSCINDRNEMIIECLSCGEKTSKDEIRIDQDFQNQMNKFIVTCRRCNWTGLWKNYQNHSHVVSSDCKKYLTNTVHQPRLNTSQTIKPRLEQINSQIIEISKNFRVIHNQIQQSIDRCSM